MSPHIVLAPGELRAIERASGASIAWVLGRFARWVRFEASKMADDPELYPDLVQIGETALWEVGHWRLDLEDRADRIYLRRFVRRRMWRARSVLRRQDQPRGPHEPGLWEPGRYGLGWHPMSGLVGMNHVVRRTRLPD